MKFSGQARLEGIAAVVDAVGAIPVIGNGDIREPADAARMIEQTGCAGVMIGRGAIGRPWLFRDTWSYLTTGEVPPPPSIQRKCELMRDHFMNMVWLRGERMATREFRKCASWWAKQMHPCRIIRKRLRLLESVGEFEEIVGEFLDWRRGWDADVAAGRVHPQPYPNMSVA
jgi:tRNA-dihydrouridine synthase